MPKPKQLSLFKRRYSKPSITKKPKKQIVQQKWEPYIRAIQAVNKVKKPGEIETDLARRRARLELPENHEKKAVFLQEIELMDTLAPNYTKTLKEEIALTIAFGEKPGKSAEPGKQEQFTF